MIFYFSRLFCNCIVFTGKFYMYKNKLNIASSSQRKVFHKWLVITQRIFDVTQNSGGYYLQCPT